MLGKSFAFPFMSRNLPQLWEKKGRIEVCDVGWGYYVVKFDTVGDYERAMFGGPWMVVLTIIGNKIGKTVRLDLTTMGGSRGNFARICVEVDLSKPLLSKYRLRRRVCHIEYEGLHTICYSCGCFGHVQDQCQKKAEEAPVEVPGDVFVNPIFQNSGIEDPRPEVEEDFGPWMKVSRAGRRSKKAVPVASTPPAALEPGGKASLGNKFGALAEEDLPDGDCEIGDQKEESNDVEDQVQEVFVEENKENFDSNLPTVGGNMDEPDSISVIAPMEVEVGLKAHRLVKPAMEEARGEAVSISKAGAAPKLGLEKVYAKKGVKLQVPLGRSNSVGSSPGIHSGRPTKGSGPQPHSQQVRSGSGGSVPLQTPPANGPTSSVDGV
ncbi:hypothetical protein LINPERHAP2_LOCUS38612 [Linum perenne]